MEWIMLHYSRGPSSNHSQISLPSVDEMSVTSDSSTTHSSTLSDTEKNIVKVLVFLTMALEPDSNDIPQQIEYLWRLKSAITFSNIVGYRIRCIQRGRLEIF